MSFQFWRWSSCSFSFCRNDCLFSLARRRDEIGDDCKVVEVDRLLAHLVARKLRFEVCYAARLVVSVDNGLSLRGRWHFWGIRLLRVAGLRSVFLRTGDSQKTDAPK